MSDLKTHQSADQLARRFVMRKLASASLDFIKTARSVSSLLRLARAGRASPAQLAQLNYKQLGGRDRLTNMLLANPANPSSVHPDVVNKFRGINANAGLEQRIKNLQALGPNSGWENVQGQMGRFQQNLRTIKGQMPQDVWASDDAIRFARNYGKQLSRDPLSGFTKNMQPNIHRQIFQKPGGPTVGGTTFVPPFGGQSRIRLYPQSQTYNNVPLQTQNNYSLFHEYGHAVDPSWRQFNNMLGTQTALRFPQHTSIAGAINRTPQWKNTFDIQKRRAESFADGFAGNTMNRYQYRQGARTTQEVDRLGDFLRQRYNGYGGNFTGTTLPQNYRFGFVDPMQRTNQLMETLHLNGGQLAPGTFAPVTMKSFRTGPGVVKGKGPVSPVFQ